MQKTTVSLRERNRLETWMLIHDKASELALEEGLSKATVEAIAEAAGISKRTFFNYFATKEDAILGTQAPTLSEDATAAFRAAGADDLFARTVHLMVSVIRSMFPEESHRERRKLLKAKYPELARRIFVHVRASEELVENQLMDRYDEQDPEFESIGLPDGRDSAMALLMLAGTVVRFAFMKNPSVTTSLEDAAVDEAIEIFREAIKVSL